MALMLATITHAQVSNDGLAKVMKRQGIEIYIMSEPVKEYTVAGKVTATDVGTFLNAFAKTKDERLDDIRKMIDILITNANRKQKKGKLEYDAIMTEDGTNGILIKFKTDTPKKE